MNEVRLQMMLVKNDHQNRFFIQGKDISICQVASLLEEERKIFTAAFSPFLHSGLFGSFDRSNATPDGCLAWHQFTPLSIDGVTVPFDTTAVSSIEDLHGKRVLSLGEGNTGLVPYLAENQVDAYGLDLNYGTKNHKHMLRGDATKFVGSAIKPNSFDLILSSYLLCDIGYDSSKKALIESVKALKVGGYSRNLFFNHEKIDPASKEFAEMLSQVKAQFSKNRDFDIEISLAQTPWQGVDGTGNVPSTLLIIKKIPK